MNRSSRAVESGSVKPRRRGESLQALLQDRDRLVEAVSAFPSIRVPEVYRWTGDARLEDLFDNEFRHESGKKPYDYLKGWLGMLRPFAYATKDDSWGEMEKLLSIVMRNYLRMAHASETLLAALPEPPPPGQQVARDSSREEP